ncbi:MAG: hypothetical protein L0332_32715 [Chloroflexi bacterium]|nr:hypothetical protein [Chloroflexota bacterium]
MSKQRIGIALWAVSLLSIFWVASAQAQVKGGRWSGPYRLSSEAGKASEGYLVADQYGFVHCFWTETLFENQRSIMQYARFDGETWSTPNEIYLTGRGINNISPVVDRQGTLHIAWTEGLSGPAYYTHAPANNALSARDWAQPIQIDIPANQVRLRVDSKGVFHILYINRMEESGVYYVRSEDQGTTWSEPAWLDPDILPNHIPDSLNFELDEADGLHAVWFYGALDQSRPDWVRYAHSLDGGNTWSVPFMIDQYVQESEHELTAASPVMIVQGQTVHVIWAAGPLPYRHHRFSTDAGQTWSAPRQIFGELHGQAFDGLAVDGAGGMHFFGQIRYPVGIYHASWDQTQWTPPSLIYLIAQEGEEIGDRIHAHHTHPVVRAGDQLVLTFADGPADPNRRLFAMHRILDDTSSLAAVPKGAPTATPVSVPSPTPEQPTPMPTLTATAPSFDAAIQPVGQVPRPDLALWAALVPTLLLLGGTVVIRLLYKPKL